MLLALAAGGILTFDYDDGRSFAAARSTAARALEDAA